MRFVVCLAGLSVVVCVGTYSSPAEAGCLDAAEATASVAGMICNPKSQAPSGWQLHSVMCIPTTVPDEGGVFCVGPHDAKRGTKKHYQCSIEVPGTPGCTTAPGGTKKWSFECLDGAEEPGNCPYSPGPGLVCESFYPENHCLSGGLGRLEMFEKVDCFDEQPGEETRQTCFEKFPIEDRDCDGSVGCADDDCKGLRAEVCNNLIDDDCDGAADCDDEDDCVTGKFQTCGVTADTDCRPETSPTDPTACKKPVDDPRDGADNDGDGHTDEDQDQDPCGEFCGDCRGEPVDLLTRAAYIGPHEDVRIASPQGGDSDLVFSRSWSSVTATNDVGPDAVDEPPQVLGPGWRHSLDIRLLLEMDGMGQVTSVVLRSPDQFVRMHLLVDDPVSRLYGRNPIRDVTVEEIGGVWWVKLEDGTLLVFDETVDETTLHPLVPGSGPIAGVQHLRIREVHPGGFSYFGHRFYYEGDPDGPPNMCVGVGGIGDSRRGLLMAVAQDWYKGTYRGSSLHFNYTNIASSQVRLATIVEGADRETGSTATILAQFTYSGTQVLLRQVHSCLDMANDTALCGASIGVAPNGSELVAYNYASSPSHLISQVSRPRPTSSSSPSTLTRLPAEEFTWSSTRLVIAHKSPGIILTAPSTSISPDGATTWTVNGVSEKTTFEKGIPVRTERLGTFAATTRERTRTTSTADDRFVVGAARSKTTSGEEVTLREFDDKGRTVFEVTLSHLGGSPSLAEPNPVGGCTSRKINNASPGMVRRAAGYYYDADDISSPGRLLGVATWSTAVESQASATTIVLPSAAPGSWSTPSTFATRTFPAASASCGGVTYFWDVDVTDYSGGIPLDASNPLAISLNGMWDDLPTWQHRLRPYGTSASSVTVVATSTLTVRDYAGRTITTVSSEARGTASAIAATKPAERLMSRTIAEYLPLDHNDRRQRGRLLRSTSYAGAQLATGGLTGPTACSTSAYSELGELECSDQTVTMGSSSKVRTQTTTTADASSHIRTETTTSSLSPVTISAESTRLADGTILSSRTVGGNKMSTFWSPASASGASAAWLTRPTSTLQHSASGVLLVRQDTLFDTHGKVKQVDILDGTPVLQHQTLRFQVPGYDGDLAQSEPQRVAGSDLSGPWVGTTTSYDPASLRVLNELTMSGEETEYIYDAAHRLQSVNRKLAADAAFTTIRQFDYNVSGELTDVYNGDDLVGSYTYGEDGRLLTETMHAAPASNGPLTNSYVRTLSQVSGNWVSKAQQTMRNSYVVRDNIDSFDNLGRLTSSYDNATASTFIQNYYDQKPAGYFGSYTVDGPRTIALTQSSNQLGRLAMVKHPAGLTLYEYDALGRITVLVQYDGNPSVTPLVAGSMRVFQVTYDSVGRMTSLRYPSGRKVNYTQGDDARGPVAIGITAATTGSGTVQSIASDIHYDVDGRASDWGWGNDTTPGRHTITRDKLGRVLSIVDTDTNDVEKYRHEYSDYDGDGSTTHLREEDSGGGSILNYGSMNLDFDFVQDKLTTWNDLDGEHNLSIGPTGLRESEWINGTTYDYVQQWAGGEGINRRTATSYPKSIDLNWFSSAAVSSIDWGYNGSYEITSFIRGPRGDYVGYTATAGAYTQQRDQSMRRWYLQGPAAVERFGWAPDGNLVDRYWKSTASGDWERDEYVYLQGMPIGVTHTTFSAPTAVSWWLVPDAIGTPRRVIERYGQMRQRVGLKMNPWGQGTEAGMNTSIGLAPRLPFRLPGQFADASNLVENGYRTYLPDLGVYLQPDPMHRDSVMSGNGPQAYAYANGNPLRYTDPDGLYALDSSWDADPAAKAIGKSALDGLRSFSRCGCAFKEVHKRVPFNDFFRIHYGISFGAETFGLTPFQEIFRDPLGNPGLNPNNFLQIDIGKTAIQEGVTTTMRTMAHEMTHASFSRIDVPNIKRGDPYQMEDLCDPTLPDVFAYSSPLTNSDVRGIKKCCECSK